MNLKVYDSLLWVKVLLIQFLHGTNIKHITTLRVYNMMRTFKILMWHYILHINCACVECCCAHRIATKSADSGTYIAHNLRYMIATGEVQVTHRNMGWDKHRIRDLKIFLCWFYSWLYIILILYLTSKYRSVLSTWLDRLRHNQISLPCSSNPPECSGLHLIITRAQESCFIKWHTTPQRVTCPN